MKLLNFKLNGEVKLGVKTEQGILDIEKAGQEFNEDVPKSMKDLIKGKGLSTIRKLADRTANNSYPSLFLNEEKIVYQPVIQNPEKIVCVGLNYLSHVEEAKTEEIPKAPVLFSKFNNSLSAHNERISLPSKGNLFDYEAELVIVIGEEARNVEENEALSFVFGYTVGNDLSIRDLQFTSSQWLLGKSADGFAPIGPYIVPAEEVDPQNLNIECRVNGEVRQSSNTKHMIFDCATIVSYISKHITLKPGDIIFTGTPEGVILGLPENEQIWLTSGDEMEITIEGIGTLRNILE
ncbi:fumarylacetoacetate hydrolase family protein [Neobacillus niacini]|uniref:fumarylacetoacetate hydrolase family protein n=1 Tax=Neobacillus niacini TaxID=86668 RepID=UPI0021CAFA7A|nr:fumarylacetoacetate hydrolase family protein [Neobacillus niacini]MCM3766019.1 fumarylacetoacetate hydrolase family protein [Neobacillus niacini]